MIFLATYFIQIPAPTGYINPGDGVILLASVWLGYFSAVPAALGGAMADIFSGYAIYTPGTLLIKAGMAILAVFIMRTGKDKLSVRVLAFCAAEVSMVAGYFLYDILLYGIGGAIVNISGNAVQAFVSVVLGLALSRLPKLWIN